MAPPPKTMTHWQYRHYLDHAAILASVRSLCWCDAQMEILDRVIVRLADQYAEDAASFDRQWFYDKSKCGFGRIHTTTKEVSDG